MDIPSRYRWDAKLLRAKQYSAAENKRVLHLEYLPEFTYFQENRKIRIEEEWFDVFPSTKLLLLKNYEHVLASFVFSPFDSSSEEKSLISLTYKKNNTLFGSYL
jgi:hypothetical protein